jgi:hypothetical protein
MTAEGEVVIARSDSDEEIQTISADAFWIASRALAMTWTESRERIPAMRKLPVVHIFPCAVGQITTMLPHVPHPHEGRFAIVTDVGSGMRWTRRVV